MLYCIQCDLLRAGRSCEIRNLQSRISLCTCALCILCVHSQITHGLWCLRIGCVLLLDCCHPSRYDGLDWDTLSHHNTHLILFSLEVVEDGSLTAMDRLPKPESFIEARKTTLAHSTKLLICFGGYGRSGGFPVLVCHHLNWIRTQLNVAIKRPGLWIYL